MFEGRILPFAEAATSAYSRIRSKAGSTGKTTGVADALIAAIAAHHQFTIATQDISPFQAVGISVINPWSK